MQLGAGNDILLAGLGNDIANGGQGSDLMSGGSGNDDLAGDNGSDVLAGNAGNDMMNGGNGDDALIDGLGSDIANGGNGDDWFFVIQPQLLGGTTNRTLTFSTAARASIPSWSGFTRTSWCPSKPTCQNFHAGQSFTFTSMNLTITGIEQIVLTTDPASHRSERDR